MIVLSNTVAQTINPGEAAAFNNVILHTGCSECHRKGTGSVKMKNNGVYELHFSGNIGGDAGTQANLALALGGDRLVETNMVATITTATDVFNVATATAVKNCCCDFDRVTVINTGTTPVTLAANPSFYVKRIG